MKKIIMVIFSLILILSGCSSSFPKIFAEKSLSEPSYTLSIPKGFEIKQVSPSENRIFKNGELAGGFSVISAEEKEAKLKKLQQQDSHAVLEDINTLYFPAKRVILPFQNGKGNGIGEIHYFLEDKQNNHIYYVFFLMPYFDYKTTLMYMKTFRPTEQL